MTKQNHTTSSGSPFEQVRLAEDHEHARVEEAKKKWEHATLDALRDIDTKKVKKMDELHVSLTDELKSATTTEADGVIHAAREGAKKDISTLDAHAAKHRKKAEEDLLKKALDPTFLLA